MQAPSSTTITITTIAVPLSEPDPLPAAITGVDVGGVATEAAVDELATGRPVDDVAAITGGDPGVVAETDVAVTGVVVTGGAACAALNGLRPSARTAGLDWSSSAM